MRTLSFVFLLFFVNKSIAQIVIPTKMGKDFDKGYYHLPLKLLVKDMWKASEGEKKDMVQTIRDFGFRDTIILVLPPQYPNKAFRDSIDILCKREKVASVVEVTFGNFTSNWYNFKKTETSVGTVTVTYKAYDYTSATLMLPGIVFAAGSFGSIKKMFNNAVPDLTK